MAPEPQAKRPPAFPKWLLQAQVFLLRKGWMGPMNDQLMVMTTTGRKSGKPHTIPIGYLRDGERLLAFNRDGTSNWVKNISANPEVTLEFRGQPRRYRAEVLRDPEAREPVFQRYLKEKIFRRVMGLDETPTPEAIEQARREAGLVRFHPL